jgi:hypothetical protein
LAFRYSLSLGGIPILNFTVIKACEALAMVRKHVIALAVIATAVFGGSAAALALGA